MHRYRLPKLSVIESCVLHILMDVLLPKSTCQKYVFIFVQQKCNSWVRIYYLDDFKSFEWFILDTWELIVENYFVNQLVLSIERERKLPARML